MANSKHVEKHTIAMLDHAEREVAELNRRLTEIIELVEGGVDITENGGPNLEMQILTIARGEDIP